jgi:hypothetical protein
MARRRSTLGVMYRDTRARQSFLRQAGSGIFVALKPKGLPKVMHALLVSLIVFGSTQSWLERRRQRATVGGR